jgi:sigma-B regulation protein RsbU (phosphoserine phosphatase)
LVSGARPILRLVRDDDPPRPLSVTQDISSDDLDPEAQLQAMRNEVAVLNVELAALQQQEHDRRDHFHQIDEELRLAARLQQDFLPKSLPSVGRVDFHALFRPAGYVSGDFYDVIRLDENHVGFYIADAVGHGVPAALLTMFIKHALCTKVIAGDSYRLLQPAETLSRLNQKLIEQGLSAATFATAVYGTINVHTLSGTFARAGHPHPLLLRAGGEIESLETEGGLLGIFAGETFQERSFTLATGDKLLLCTDGADVALGDEEVNVATGMQRWQDAVNATRRLPAAALVQYFAAQLDAARGTADAKDDLTMLVLEAKR